MPYRVILLVEAVITELDVRSWGESSRHTHLSACPLCAINCRRQLAVPLSQNHKRTFGFKAIGIGHVCALDESSRSLTMDENSWLNRHSKISRLTSEPTISTLAAILPTGSNSSEAQ